MNFTFLLSTVIGICLFPVCACFFFFLFFVSRLDREQQNGREGSRQESHSAGNTQDINGSGSNDDISKSSEEFPRSSSSRQQIDQSTEGRDSDNEGYLVNVFLQSEQQYRYIAA